MAADDSTWYMLTISITSILLVLSTIYTIRNVLKIWRKGSPIPVSDKTSPGEKTIGENTDEEVEDNETERPVMEGGDAPEIDPMQYCEHIQSEVKKAKIRVAEKRIGETMTPEQIAEEKELQRKQLEEIFRLMQEQNEKFGVSSVEDIQNQMKLYV